MHGQGHQWVRIAWLLPRVFSFSMSGVLWRVDSLESAWPWARYYVLNYVHGHGIVTIGVSPT